MFEKCKITEWLIENVKGKYLLGPFADYNKIPIANKLHISPIGAVPKDVTNIRPIHHLSAPRNGESINSRILEAYTVGRICIKRACYFDQKHFFVIHFLCTFLHVLCIFRHVLCIHFLCTF